LKRAGDAANGPAIAGVVREVEYQGTYVRIAITADSGADISAQLSEDQYDCANYAPGDRVIATWDAAQASLLGAIRSSVTVRSPEPAI
jgi:putative spermidine/putrescine transport system ATP-binding protein